MQSGREGNDYILSILRWAIVAFSDEKGWKGIYVRMCACMYVVVYVSMNIYVCDVCMMAGWVAWYSIAAFPPIGGHHGNESSSNAALRN